MLTALVLAATAQGSDANTIVLRHTRPAQDVTMTKTSQCGDTEFTIQYVQTRAGVTGKIAVMDAGKPVAAQMAQAQLFDHLSYVSDTTVSCGDETLPSQVLVMGVDKKTGEVEQLYGLGYLPSTGFSTINGPRNRLRD